MSLVTVTDAARLSNKSSQTLYRHIKAGKLSRESNGLIQTAELIRVYGELKSSESHVSSLGHNKVQHYDVDVVSLLQTQIAKLENDLKTLKAESLERERQAIEREKRLMALLENKQEILSHTGLFGSLFKK